MFVVVEVINKIRFHICDANSKESAEFIADKLSNIYKNRKIEAFEIKDYEEKS